MPEIRAAKIEDAEAACELVRRSIVELCIEDHAGERMALEGWLSNKTLRNMQTWIKQLGVYTYVSTQDDRIIGVATLTGAGEIMLLYVAPEFRFQGVSKALLAQAEDKARELRLDFCSLTSSLTARRFFLAAGYELMSDEEEDDGFGLDAAVSMTKRLTPES